MSKLNKKQIKEILSKRFENDSCTKLSQIPKPFLFKDMKKAVKKIKQTIDNKEQIAIVGDYDVDGIVASVILSEFLDFLNISHEVYIPNRFIDGYGLNPSIVEKINAKLIITVDNGISAFQAATKCKELDINLIITDHHLPLEGVPDAYAVINPKQVDCNFPNQEICGAQVSWYLVAALKQELNVKYDLSSSLDLLSIAIMADMMELKDLNRTIVKKGIRMLSASKRAAFLEIKEIYQKKKFIIDDISFLIAPLINSSGRMDDAKLSFRFLKSKTKQDARNILNEIINLNNLRKEEEKSLFDSSLKYAKDSQNVIVVWGEDWHEGVVGIVASRLTRHFNKPAIVFSIDDERAKGSARSIEEIDLLKIISANDDLLLAYGGHKGAAGLSIKTKDLPAFRKKINSCDIQLCEINEFQKEILGEIDPSEIDFELLEILEYFEPYGQKNPKPYFELNNFKVKKLRFLGEMKNHLKLIIQKEGFTYEALFFNFNKAPKIGDKINLVFNISKNNYRGYVTPQLLIKSLEVL